MSRAAGLAAALPPALLEGEDDALVDVAAFQLAVGLGGLLHGHGFVRAQAEPAIGHQGDRLIQDTLSGRVEHGVHRAQRADPAGQARAVPHRRRSQLAGEHFVVLADRADHLDPPGDRELRRDDADGSAAADQQQRLTALDVQLPEDTDGRLGRAGQRGGIDPRDGVWLAGPDRRHRVLGVPAQAQQQGRDAVAEGRAGDTGPDRVDGACRLEAEHGVRGQRDGLDIAGPQDEIGWADAGGLDLDPDLSLTRFPQRDPGPLQHLRWSVSSHHNCVGHSSSFLSGRGLGMAANGNFRPVSVFLTVGYNTSMNMLSKPVERCRKTSYSLNLSLVLSALNALYKLLEKFCCILSLKNTYRPIVLVHEFAEPTIGRTNMVMSHY